MEEILLTFGDIIWGDRSYKAEEIDERHQSGPFIVLEQDGDFLYAIKGYGLTKNKDESKYDNYNLYVNPGDRENHRLLRKTTNFRTNYIDKVPISCVQNYIGRLSDDQIESLKRKMLQNYQHMPEYGTMLKNKLSFYLKNGDVIYNPYNDLTYLVIDDKNDSYVIAIPFYLNKKKNKDVYKLDEPMKFSKLSDNNYVKTIRPDKFRRIHDSYLALKLQEQFPKNESSIIKKGTVITYEKNLFYVTTIENGECLCYELFFDEQSDISIGNIPFKVNFNQKQISLNSDKIAYICDLTEDIVTKFKELKKESKRLSKKEKKSNNNKLDRVSGVTLFGKIIHSKNFPCVRFAAFSHPSFDCLEVVDLEELSKGYFKTRIFKIEHLSAYGAKHSDFVDFIKSIQIEISDERYEEFLKLNGIYYIKRNDEGISRTRK